MIGEQSREHCTVKLTIHFKTNMMMFFIARGRCVGEDEFEYECPEPSEQRSLHFESISGMITCDDVDGLLQRGR